MTYPYGGPPSGPQQPPPYGLQPGPVPPQPYGAPGYPPMQYHPFGKPAEWGTRVLGYLVDAAISGGATLALVLVIGILAGVAAGAGGSGAAALGVVAVLLYIVGLLGITALNIWNFCYRRGTTGQTVGQKVVKIKTISEEHGRPLGFGAAFLRQLCHILDSLPCNIGFLAPLWDEKNQTWADKIMKSVVVSAEQPTAPMPPGGAYPGSGGFPPQQPGYGPPPQQW